MVTEAESELGSAEEALLGALNEEISGRATSLVPATSPTLTRVLHRRLYEVKHSIEVRCVELKVAVEMSQKLDDKLRDISGHLDEIAQDTESFCRLPHVTGIDLQQHISQQKVLCQILII